MGMSQFRFGRKYSTGFRLVDRLIEMNKLKRIVLTRNDMITHRTTVPLSLIGSHDFRESSVTRRGLAQAELVLFVDDDGSTKILKSRHGYER